MKAGKSDCAPDFIGIGAHKAATNWVWHNLKQHPEIWMPPVKELHWFDRSPRYPSPSYLYSARLSERLFGRGRHNAHFRRMFPRKLLSLIRDRDWQGLRWQWKHFVGYYDDDWYFSLFEDGRGRLKGEITPSYSVLDVEDVRGIRRLIPDLKIILMLRNPIDRAWSHVRFDWTRQWFKGIDSLDEIKSFIDGPKQRLRGDYLRTIDNWAACFPDDRIFIGFYEDVQQRPQGLLADMHEFLGVRPLAAADSDSTDIQERKNVSDKKDVPAEILRYLAAMYRPDIEKLHDRFGGHTAAWLEEANRILGQPESTSVAERS